MAVRLGLPEKGDINQIIFGRALQCLAKACRENTVGMFKDPSAAGAEGLRGAGDKEGVRYQVLGFLQALR